LFEKNSVSQSRVPVDRQHGRLRGPHTPGILEPLRRVVANNVKRLSGVHALRLRVGGYRVIFCETAETITILDIGPRGDIYE
jgi:mRNA-degrading endonuclease RelE of RelBE toxin-antitoxin system